MSRGCRKLNKNHEWNVMLSSQQSGLLCYSVMVVAVPLLLLLMKHLMNERGRHLTVSYTEAVLCYLENPVPSSEVTRTSDKGII